MLFPTSFAGPLVDQARHTLLNKAASFLPDAGSLDTRLATPFSHPFGKQHDGPDNFVVVLDIVHEFELQLVKFF